MAEESKLSSGYSYSDKLAVALACLAGVMAIILFLVEKTPPTVVGLLMLMVVLSIYPILHFSKTRTVRAVLLTLTVIGTIAFGWLEWPKPVFTPKETKQQSAQIPIQSPADSPSKNPLSKTKPKKVLPESAHPEAAIPQEHVAVKVEKGARWISTNDTFYAPNGTGIENKGEITSKGLRVNPPPIVSQNCPGGICAGGDINGNPTIINRAPEPQISFALDSEELIPVSPSHPHQCVKISTDRLLESPQFVVFCDRACKAVYGIAVLTSGIKGNDRWGWIPGHPDLAIFKVGMPNPLPSDVKYLACVESEDSNPIHILDVKRLISTGQ